MRVLFLLILLFSSQLFADSLDEKIGQLFMAAMYPSKEAALAEGQTEDPTAYIERMIRDYHLGAVLFKMHWKPEQIQQTIKHFQDLSALPLFIAIDAEWGLNMRIPSIPPFPKNVELGKLENEEIIFEIGREIGSQCRSIGINWNFAPVVDINTNPENPIINVRSFGNNKEKVARMGVQMIRGLQSQRILATAKHFPGHGDTSTDSHLSLPVVPHSYTRLYSEELVPFKAAIEAGVKSVMCAHLLVREIEPTLPSSLSPKIVSDLLQKEMNFQGLVITDDLIMGAIKTPPSETALLAFQAGNDVILMSHNIEEGIQAIKDAVKNRVITEEEIDRRVLKIFKAKDWVHVNMPVQHPF